MINFKSLVVSVLASVAMVSPVMAGGLGESYQDQRTPNSNDVSYCKNLINRITHHPSGFYEYSMNYGVSGNDILVYESKNQDNVFIANRFEHDMTVNGMKYNSECGWKTLKLNHTYTESDGSLVSYAIEDVRNKDTVVIYRKSVDGRTTRHPQIGEKARRVSLDYMISMMSQEIDY